MIYRYSMFFGLLFLGISSAQAQHPFRQAIDSYREFLIAQNETPVDTILKWEQTLSNNGQWNDIAYDDKTSSTWKTRVHLDRLVKLSIAYQNREIKRYKNKELWTKILVAGNHWIKLKYQNPNWWHNEIGVPQFWRDLITLNFSDYSPLQLAEALGILTQYKLKENFTGANLTWSADLAMHHGLFTSNESLVAKARGLIVKEIKMSNGEGIRPDFSYHQHGARLQTHHYGEAFLTENVRLAYELNKTPWQFPQDKINILENFLIQGWQWMSRGKSISPATLDRAVSRPGALQKDISKLLPYLIVLDPKNRATLSTMIKVQNGKKQVIRGFKYFPFSDFGAYHQQDYSLFIKTISKHTEPTEQINGENQKGTLLNLGNTYLIRTGNEYLDLMPVWDWKNLPGTTLFNGAKKINRPSFAGGVNANTVGLVAMDFDVDSDRSKLKGQKIWISHTGRLFCLISGLNLNNDNDTIYTVLDQSRLQGRIVVNHINNLMPPLHTISSGIRWVNHNGFTFLPLEGCNLKVSTSKVNGSWSEVARSGDSKIITDQVFTVMATHKNLSNAAYLIDGKTKLEDLNKMVAKPDWKMVRNDSNCQAMVFADQVCFASFHQKGEVQLGKYNLKVNAPCLLIIADGEIFASNPFGTKADLELKINSKNMKLALPDHGVTTSRKL